MSSYAATIVITMASESYDSEDAGQLEGRYANYFEIGHNAFEFLLDFGQAYQQSEKAQINTRVIMSPKYAQTLYKLLGESINRYEQIFGVIPKD